MTNLWENELVWTRERIRFTDNERTKDFEKKLLWMKEFKLKERKKERELVCTNERGSWKEGKLWTKVK